MTDRELKKLRRSVLLEMLIEQSRNSKDSSGQNPEDFSPLSILQDGTGSNLFTSRDEEVNV